MTIITRSGAQQWSGVKLPPDVSHVVIPHFRAKPQYITWKQVHAQRTERIMRSLYWKRQAGTITRRALRIDVSYYDIQFYTGWHCYLHFLGPVGWQHGEWVRHYLHDSNPYNLLNLFPLANTFRDWLPAFANAYCRGSHDQRPRGCVFTWAMTQGNQVREILPPSAP